MAGTFAGGELLTVESGDQISLLDEGGAFATQALLRAVRHRVSSISKGLVADLSLQFRLLAL
jgi:hypothetical protein